MSVAYHLDHPVDVTLIGRGRKFIRALDPQRFDILEERLLEWRGKFRERNVRFAGAADRFVVHVGDVHHAMHFVTAQFEMPLKQIFEDIGAKISNVRPAVNGWPACVDADLAFGGIARFEFFDLARVGVKKAHLSCRAKSRHLSFYAE